MKCHEVVKVWFIGKFPVVTAITIERVYVFHQDLGTTCMCSLM